MVVYLDHEYRCHTADDGAMMQAQAEFFDGKCAEFIEGYRFVPEGGSWTRKDGTVFKGVMIAPFKPFHELDAVQRAYEQAQLADMKAALTLLGVNADE